MNYLDFITDEQDAKTVEKVVSKVLDILINGEHINYIAVQKKPAVNLLPDAVVVTDKRVVFCKPANLGLTTTFDIYSWKDVKEVSFKEELFGARFTLVPQSGENFTVEYIPKVQARKLFQYANGNLEKYREEQRRSQVVVTEEKSKTATEEVPLVITAAPPAFEAPMPPTQQEEDEMMQRLKKLKTLFEKQLITQEEYEQKKNDILSQL